ncbi:UNVERIFIED_CONTAM: hypothetical protein Slati_2386300 [Sesamum latifolium]|uniref:Uncharacterized protein n=1 Tax=Sesamum latifolium TaxID=2727402 RepID=A0AAW2WBM9_9LAMI
MHDGDASYSRGRCRCWTRVAPPWVKAHLVEACLGQTSQVKAINVDPSLAEESYLNQRLVKVSCILAKTRLLMQTVLSK